jgi:hypothetical protein
MSDGLQDLPEISLCPGGPNGTISNDHPSFNFARIITNAGKVGKTEHPRFHLHYFLAPSVHFL